ncbi:MAG TPA: 3-hydroxyacyl-ACP dehydratase FabZ [Luteimonas sp.]|jgi:3-hydroxyacyl-[acyl-carrier-protein] dehydratase|nr:3-hydroxyacyl-ACP dehydratase FabZ [Luteimonas sp.]
MTVQLPIDVTAIQALLPHRFPFLLVDRVVEFEPHKRVLGIKNVTINEPFFQGHFPGHQVMPGVLVIEALAQAGGVLTQLSSQVDGSFGEGKIFYLVKIDNARFSRMVVPGDQLQLEVTIKRLIRNMAMYTGIARVDGQQVASAEILCAEAKR